MSGTFADRTSTCFDFERPKLHLLNVFSSVKPRKNSRPAIYMLLIPRSREKNRSAIFPERLRTVAGIIGQEIKGMLATADKNLSSVPCTVLFCISSSYYYIRRKIGYRSATDAEGYPRIYKGFKKLMRRSHGGASDHRELNSIISFSFYLFRHEPIFSKNCQTLSHMMGHELYR